MFGIELLSLTPLDHADHPVLTRVLNKVEEIVRYAYETCYPPWAHSLALIVLINSGPRQTNDLNLNNEAWHTIGSLKLQIANVAVSSSTDVACCAHTRLDIRPKPSVRMTTGANQSTRF